MVSGKVNQAYQQAPWRKQLQVIGLFLLSVTGAAVVIGLYIYLSSLTFSAGYEIQVLNYDKSVVERKIASLESQRALLTSATEMEKRAQALNFQAIVPENLNFMMIPAYTGRETNILAKPHQEVRQELLIKPAYTQSLWEWLFEGAARVSQASVEAGK